MNLFQASQFFRSQRLGRWRWPWFLLGLVAAAGGILLVGVVAIVGIEAATMVFGFEELGLLEDDSLTSSEPRLLAVELLLVGLPFWGAAIAGTLAQGRSVRSLLAPLHRFRWGLVGKVLVLEVILQAAMIFLPIPFTGAEDPVVNYSGLSIAHAVWFVPMVFFLFIQTSGEDVFFKGFLLRQFGALTLIFWLAPAVVVGLFVLGHVGNPDLEENAKLFLPMFLLSELVIIFLLVRTQGMEIPLVLHWFNNFTLLFIYAEAGTQSNDLTLWVHERPEDEALALAGDIESVIGYGIYLVLLLVFLLWPRSPFYVGPASACGLGK